jgi:amino acid transporter
LSLLKLQSLLLILSQGTGLFLASGQALAVAGPVGALFGFIFMGLITAEIALASGELSGFKPVSGGFVRHATFFVQPALGAATGWNYCWSLHSSLSMRIRVTNRIEL